MMASRLWLAPRKSPHFEIESVTVRRRTRRGGAGSARNRSSQSCANRKLVRRPQITLRFAGRKNGGVYLVGEQMANVLDTKRGPSKVQGIVLRLEWCGAHRRGFGRASSRGFFGARKDRLF